MLDLNKMTSYRQVDRKVIKKKIDELLDGRQQPMNDRECAAFIDFAFLDNMASQRSMESNLLLVRKLYDYDHEFRYAGLCVYPNYVSLAKHYLKNTVTLVSAVTGNFPTGQSLLRNKLQETRYAIDEGADEIDYVYSVGNVIDGKYQEVADELRAVREVCKNTRLKVILETGLMNTLKEVKIVSEIALKTGADFIKTSTGKVKPGVIPEVAYMMLMAVKKIHEESGKKAGIKFSGGISSKEQIILYYYMTEKILGREWTNPDTFRIGAGALAEKMLDNALRKINKD